MTIENCIAANGDDDDERSVVTCSNGCPLGGLGRHKFSCFWAGTWFYDGRAAQILGESTDEQMVCVQVTEETLEPHVHVGRYPALESGLLSRVRYPDVTVHLSTGHDGNIFSVLGTVTGALRRSGRPDAANKLASDLFEADSFNEALQLVQRTVHVT